MKFIRLQALVLMLLGNAAYADIDFLGNTVVLNGFKLEIRFTGEYGKHVALHGQDGSDISTVVYLSTNNNRPTETSPFARSYEVYQQLIQNADVGSTFNFTLSCNTMPEFQYSGAPGTSQSLSFFLFDTNNMGCKLDWLREFPADSVYFPNN